MKSCFIVLSVLALPAFGVADDAILFNRDVRPILSDRCFICHGPNEHDRKAGLRLDEAEGSDGAYQAIEPGSIEDSTLWHRLTAEDDDVMPPPDSATGRSAPVRR